MLTDTSIELRSAAPSLVMRLVKWLMSVRKPTFPRTAPEFHAHMAQRTLPLDAPMPAKFAQKFKIEEWEAAGQKVITLHPASGPGEWHMLYFHGGGFVLPMFKEHWPLVAAMVEQCGLSVTLPMYEVVPESSYKTQDALADAAFASLAQSHDPAKIILNGDSAGGHMALNLALRLAQAGALRAVAGSDHGRPGDQRGRAARHHAQDRHLARLRTDVCR